VTLPRAFSFSRIREINAPPRRGIWRFSEMLERQRLVDGEFGRWFGDDAAAAASKPAVVFLMPMIAATWWNGSPWQRRRNASSWRAVGAWYAKRRRVSLCEIIPGLFPGLWCGLEGF